MPIRDSFSRITVFKSRNLRIVITSNGPAGEGWNRNDNSGIEQPNPQLSSRAGLQAREGSAFFASLTEKQIPRAKTGRS
jgi:hypothetical protein